MDELGLAQRQADGKTFSPPLPVQATRTALAAGPVRFDQDAPMLGQATVLGQRSDTPMQELASILQQL